MHGSTALTLRIVPVFRFCWVVLKLWSITAARPKLPDAVRRPCPSTRRNGPIMPPLFHDSVTRRAIFVAVCACFDILTGCRGLQPNPVPMGDRPNASPASVPHVTEFGALHAGPVELDLAGPQRVDVLVAWALQRNPAVQAARSRVAAAAQRVPQAASLKDPMMDVGGWPFYPYVQQSAGGRMTVDVVVSQEVPWFGERDLQAAAATQEVRGHRAALQAVTLQTVEDVKRAYYQLQYAEQSREITAQSRTLLNDVLEVATARFATGTTSQQDVLRLQAELGGVDAEIAQWRQEVATAQAELAQVLSVSPETPLETVPLNTAEDLPADVDALYRQAVATRPELRAALADVARDRYNVDLARLAYYPDVTWRAGWGEMTTNRSIVPFADGIDSVSVGLSMNLPVYRQRLDAGVAEATAEFCASAREHDALRDKTLRDVKTLFVQAHSQAEVLQLVRNTILPSSRQALDVAVREYQVGAIPFAQVVDNWRTLLRHQILEQQVQMQLRQTLAALATVVGTDPVAPTVGNDLPQPADIVAASPPPARP
jgi:outer membrane protein TolC